MLTRKSPPPLPPQRITTSTPLSPPSNSPPPLPPPPPTTSKPLSAYIIDEYNYDRINISLGTETRKIPANLLDGIDYFMGLKRRTNNVSKVLKIVPLEDIIVKKGTTIVRGKGISTLNSNYPPLLEDGFNSIIGPHTFGEKRVINLNNNAQYNIVYDYNTAIKQLKENKIKLIEQIKTDEVYPVFVYADGKIEIESL
jgi:hypothetical protein